MILQVGEFVSNFFLFSDTSLKLAMAHNTFEDVILPLLCKDSIKVIRWFQQKKIIKTEFKCDSCANWMNWTKYSRSKDGFVWKCQSKECPKYKSIKSIRVGSFFARSNISLQKWLHVMYLWCERIGETAAGRQVNISEKTMIDFYSSFREICTRYFQKNPIHLGGSGITVEIDESCFSHKPKHRRGHAPESPIWVFGIVDNSRSPAIGYMEIVEKRDAATLFPIIQKVVRQGSIIHSNEWRAYRNIQFLEYADGKANHSVNFVDPGSGLHTQTIESYWNKQKSYIKTMRGCKRSFLNAYLHEFMWHDRFCNNALENLCQHIADQYPV